MPLKGGSLRNDGDATGPGNSWTLESRRDYDRHVAATTFRAWDLRSPSTVRAALLAGFAMVFGLWRCGVISWYAACGSSSRACRPCVWPAPQWNCLHARTRL